MMADPLVAAALRIQELEALLREKDQECVEARRDRHEQLQQDHFRRRLEAVAVATSKKDRSPHMDVWSCDELAGWFQEIGLEDYCHFIFTQGSVHVFPSHKLSFHCLLSSASHIVCLGLQK